MTDGLSLAPISFRDACEYIQKHHRHHKPPQGWKFGMSVTDGEKCVGVLMAGRPVARMLDDGYTIEVTRCCTDGTPNVCSMLYAAAWRAARAIGYRRIITYTLATESGVTLKAAGWKRLREAGGGTWGRPSRPRKDTAPTCKKVLWEKTSYIGQEGE